MKLKYIFMSLFVTLISLFFSFKVEAANIDYCSYGSLKLTLPVTITVDISGFNSSYPFDINKNYYYTDSLYVYDRDTCNDSVKIPTFSGNNGMYILEDGFDVYYVTMTFYYSYNNVYYQSDYKLTNGIYSVLDTTPPSISSSALEFTLSMDEQKPLDYFSITVFAYDSNDSNVIPEIVEDYYSENHNIPGTYSIIYKACDKSNNCSKLIQTIHVIDMTPPSIHGITSIDSYMSNPITLFQIGSMLIAQDNFDGDISSSIYVDDSYYNIHYPGTYYVTFKVKDSSKNEILTPYKVVIHYFDDIIPTIEGPTHFKSYMSNSLHAQTIISNLIAHDNIDDNINNNLYIVNDEYTPNKFHTGKYTFVVSCYDNSGNESLPYIIYIEVIDNVKPTIQGNNNYKSYMSNSFKISDIKNKLIAMDNHDGNITNKINIEYENYSENSDKLGEYTILFKVKDSSNNEGLFEVTVTTIDDVLPVIYGESYYITLTNERLSLYSILNSLGAIDNVDDDISHLIELDTDSYSENYNISGTYYLTYYVGDKSGNISIPFKVKIIVNENLTFIKSLNESKVYLSNSILLSDNDILKILHIDPLKYNSIETIENTYSSNYKNIGEYKLTFQITNADFTKEYLNINVVTYDAIEKEIDTQYKQQKKKETILSYIISFFINLFSIPKQ